MWSKPDPPSRAIHEATIELVVATLPESGETTGLLKDSLAALANLCRRLFILCIDEAQQFPLGGFG